MGEEWKGKRKKEKEKEEKGEQARFKANGLVALSVGQRPTEK